ncbi:hypothetical protein B0H10DRAFT_1967134 [Mycena sp. CBHHK59/15]|nr:hypothetical protein B0H10DRAFT_1967134 [Mycena sp. CBHHK59/15]
MLGTFFDNSAHQKKDAPVAESLTDSDPDFIAPTKGHTCQVPAQSPLPTRMKPVINPGAPDMPCAKWSSTEVTQAQTRKALRQLQLAEMEAAKIALLAQMEVEEEEEEMMPTATFGALGATLGEAASASDEVESDIYHIALQDLDKDYDQVMDDHNKKVAQAHELASKPQGKKKKQSKGETRAAIEEAKDKLRLEGKKKRMREDEMQGGNKKLKTLFPSGVVDNWRDKIPVTTGSKTKTSSTMVATTTTPLGGLTDRDAHGTAPTRTQPAGQVVDIDSNSDSSDSMMPIEPQPKARGTASTVFVKVEPKAKALLHVDFSNIKPKGGKRAPANIAPMTMATASLMPVAGMVAVTSNGGGGNPGGSGVNNVSGLPHFSQARWVTNLLPSLSTRLGSLKHPWGIPSGDMTFIQELLDQVYPGSGYQAKDRINDKCSYFGCRAITTVDTFFQGEKYIGKPEKIAVYTQRALRDDGPGLWRKGAPAGLEVGDIGYIKPNGVFLSKHIINVFAPFVKSTAGSVHNWGPLTSGLAMSAAGYKVDDGSKFSREQVSDLIMEYGQSVAKLSPCRWGLIMEKCHARNLEDTAQPISATTMTANRAYLFGWAPYPARKITAVYGLIQTVILPDFGDWILPSAEAKDDVSPLLAIIDSRPIHAHVPTRTPTCLPSLGRVKSAPGQFPTRCYCLPVRNQNLEFHRRENNVGDTCSLASVKSIYRMSVFSQGIKTKRPELSTSIL